MIARAGEGSGRGGGGARVRRRALTGIDAWLRSTGVTRAQIAACGVTPASLDDESWMPFAEMLDIYGHVGSLRPGFGIELALRREIEHIGPIAASFRYAPTLRTAFVDSQRLIASQNTAFTLEFVDRDGIGSAEVCISMPSALRRQADEWTEETLTIITRMSRDVAGDDVQPVRVEMRHRGRAPAAGYEAIFGRPPEFASPRDAITLDADALDRPNRRHDRSVYRFLLEHVADRMPAGSDIVGEVTQIIGQVLPTGSANLPAVARHLGTGPRTLQRVLARHDCSFSELLERERRRLAERLLTEPDRTIADVARTLGYRDQSAFTHAFTRWHGMPPRAWKRVGA